VSRFLFVVPPLSGHVNPTLALADELRGRGHDVAWTGLPGAVERLLPAGSAFLASGSADAGAAASVIAERPPEVRGAAALKFLWQDVLLPLARAMVDGVDAAVDAFAPDVLVVDQQALAGAVVARRRGLPWATSATTSAELTDPLAGLPMVDAAVKADLVQLQVDHGLPAAAAAEGDLRFSPHLVLAYTTEALVGPGPYPGTGLVAFVGPSIPGGEPDRGTFPWDRLEGPDPLVYVSLGTLNAEAGARFWQVACEAVADRPWRAVFAAPPDLVPALPPNAMAFERVPQLALLRQASAVVSHAGHNTVCETLAAGVPLVLAPIRDDQPVVADQVVRAGAGVRVRFLRVKPPELAAAVDQALTDPALRAGAAAVQASFAAAGGPPAAAAHLESLVP
jgi:MGT family glycosyltransferase